MRLAARPALLTLGAVAAALLLSSGQATAGGPTSVLVANPGTGEAAALYVSDDRYGTLQDALAPAAGTETAPDNLRGGPGTTAINVTWMWHDVTVWRVDRVRVDVQGGPWVLTNQSDGSDPESFWANTSWHKAAHPDGLLDVLSSLGVLNEVDASGTDAAEPAPTTSDNTASLAADVPTGTAGSSTSVWWLLPVAASGVVLGAFGRPYAGRWVRRWRAAGPRQELIDM
ncbi:MAG: hypothetical protein ACODAF_00945 [Actinomycetota bacterium]